MARPTKDGLDYFPLDVDFFEDEKILAISGEFAVKGEIITLRLLCEIYRNGYFVEYSELLRNKLARLSSLSTNLIDEVTGKLVKYGFFDESVFREHSVLTSKGIQKRYLEAIKRRKNSLCKHYWLLNEVNVYINPRSSVVNDNISTQSKVKESKVNKRKESDKEKITTNAEEIPISDDPEIPDWQALPVSKICQDLLKSQIWKESICMHHGMNIPEVDAWVKKFESHLKASGEEEKNLRDAKKHFSSWIRIQLEIRERNGSKGQLGPPLVYDNPEIPPDKSGKWIWLNNAWRDTSKFSTWQKREHGIDV